MALQEGLPVTARCATKPSRLPDRLGFVDTPRLGRKRRPWVQHRRPKSRMFLFTQDPA